MAQIEGKEIQLPGRRAVFVGRVNGSQDRYVLFKNGTAIHSFRLSGEAAHALAALLSQDAEAGEPASYPGPEEGEPASQWQEVKETDA